MDLRRAARYNLGPLSDYEAEEALAVTMEQGGKAFAPDALAAAVRAVGFPYMLQLVGFRSWKHAAGRAGFSARACKQEKRLAGNLR